MWKDVKTRKHTVTRVFPAKFPDWPNNDLGFMAFGSVQYEEYAKLEGCKGSGRIRDWAAQGQLRQQEDGGYKLAYYRVYLACPDMPELPKRDGLHASGHS
jgi:hypothetical protein